MIMRYTQWSDDEREDFIYQIVQKLIQTVGIAQLKNAKPCEVK